MTTVRGGRRRLFIPILLSAPWWPFVAATAYAEPPAVLQFAEQYHPKPATLRDQPQTSRAENGKLRQVEPKRRPQKAAQKKAPRPQPLDRTPVRQEVPSAQAQPPNIVLNNRHTEPAQTPLPLRRLWSTLQDAALGTPDERKLRIMLRGLQTQLNEKDRLLRTLQASNTETKAVLTRAETERQNQLAETAAIKQDNRVLQQRLSTLQATPDLDNSASRLAYAAGSAMGRDMIALLNERQAWGVSVDRQRVLQGIIDSFLGQYRLSPAQLTAALAEAETQMNQAHAGIIKKQRRAGERFITQFSKLPGAHQSPSGFWYRITYAGDERLTDEARLDVVVKESLTDGTVIQDMDVQGNVLSQPLNDYPPLFREALGYLRNHGAITLVVPAQLAYGDSGSPPKIPPGATMVYELRLDGVRSHKTR
ncbi:FKBP-type peptidyl-prolyl cis-trans isomerase N-terminal domain-containing protein [Serratia rubidaea]|uniref:peptidylprolyl isomerase n=1 Tax=Serratia rubidaea TaxID=61652 RepID=A0ABS0MDT5_SERRU|nr:FKBP-type peptidyl-prolyl cis-trans isomerase N-terminal domain-containing protein [Serratia rubidaea]MBH1930447.1 FKBP-type peptidyl-prolyl cis-trans isomerase [Serratia rubidaea]MDC6117547.1 FKBP-type peptidyl-prolyl cis-trans isomerase N-terminal domain-containing protein [Serratia rubidaea]MEB7586073.1 FKBP-type peptidyl-prolyl cis-trans isomerase [Serratia rubidaea]